MRVELSDAGNYPPLRDYFLRLGASVASRDGLTFDVEFPRGLLDEDENPEMYLETWVRARRLEARVVATVRRQVLKPSGTQARPRRRTRAVLRLRDLGSCSSGRDSSAATSSRRRLGRAAEAAMLSAGS